MARKKPSLEALDHKIWAAAEFGGVDLGDARLNKRLVAVTASFAMSPQSNIPEASGDWAEAKAAYRFFSNDAVDKDLIFEAHRKSTLERMKDAELVLAVQDTTYLTYAEQEGLGWIGENSSGLMVHSTLALNKEGRALGLLHVSMRARQARIEGRARKAANREALEQKESYRWVESLAALEQAALPQGPRIVSISDREGDFYEFFLAALQAKKRGSGVDLLVRAAHQRRVEESATNLLWEYVSGQKAAEQLSIEVPRRVGGKARTAQVSIRFCPVTLEVPRDRQKHQKLTESLALWAIELREENPPKGTEPLHWRLLTTLEIATLDQAIESIRWYTLRWQIEIFHKILKSGCKAEERQLETRERLERVLALDMIIAWRILALCKEGRQTPGCPATVLFEDYEWKALHCYTHKSRACPKEPPTLGQMMVWVGKLGGFLARKSDGDPGPIVLWRGLQRLRDIAETWLIYNPSETCG
jgi:hypothetical protein